MHFSFLATLFFLLSQGGFSLAQRLKIGAEASTFMEDEGKLLTELKKTTGKRGNLEWKRNSLSEVRFVIHLEMRIYGTVVPRKLTLDFPVHRDAKKKIW